MNIQLNRAYKIRPLQRKRYDGQHHFCAGKALAMQGRPQANRYLLYAGETTTGESHLDRAWYLRHQSDTDQCVTDVRLHAAFAQYEHY
jgi:hypothetical protein